jgi:hypothetical protein
MDKVGFELSPWSTHGYLRKIKGLTQAKVNQMAQDNFEKEMEKHRSFFREYNIYALIYTDNNLKDISRLFETEVIPLLSPEKPERALSFQIMEEFLND